MSTIGNRIKVLDQLKPFVGDEETYGRIHCDLHDLIEASEWLISEIDKRIEEPLMTADDVEGFLIDLDVHFVQHVTYHFKTLRKDMAAILRSFPDTGEQLAEG